MHRVRGVTHTRLRHDAGERDVTGRPRMTFKIMGMISQKAAAYIECKGAHESAITGGCYGWSTPPHLHHQGEARPWAAKSHGGRPRASCTTHAAAQLGAYML